MKYLLFRLFFYSAFLMSFFVNITTIKAESFASKPNQMFYSFKNTSDFNKVNELITTEKNNGYSYYVLFAIVNLSDSYPVNTYISAYNSGTARGSYLAFFKDTPTFSVTNRNAMYLGQFFSSNDSILYRCLGDSWANNWSKTDYHASSPDSENSDIRVFGPDTIILNTNYYIAFANFNIKDINDKGTDFSYTYDNFVNNDDFSKGDESPDDSSDDDGNDFIKFFRDIVRLLGDIYTTVTQTYNNMTLAYSDAFKNTFVPTLNSLEFNTAYNNFESLFYNKYPILRQVSTILNSFTNKTTFEFNGKTLNTSASLDTGYYNDGNTITGLLIPEFSFDMPKSWKKNKDDKFRLFNPTAEVNGQSHLPVQPSVFILVHDIISAFFWVAYAFKLYRRFPQLLDSFLH